MEVSGTPRVTGATTAQQAVLLVNTQSRQGAMLHKEASLRLLARGFDLVETFAVDDPRRLAETTQRAIALESPLLIVGGGDGTVSYVAGNLAYRNTTLGILPLGTTNNFARNLRLPFDLDSAMDVLSNGRVVHVDLGQIDGHYFGNVCSIGLTVEAARNAPTSLKRRIGRPAYVVAGARQLLQHQPFRVVVSSEGRQYHYHTHQMIIANGGFHGGRRIAEDADVLDCRLTIFPIGDHRRASAVLSVLSFQYGRTRWVWQDDFISTTEATVETDPPRDIEIDGEIVARTPLRVAIACKALRVMAPGSVRGTE